MTQADLAERLAITHGITLDPTAITRMETGKRMIRLNEAAAIADILGIGLHLSAQGFTFRLPSPDEVERRRLLARLATIEAQIAEASRVAGAEQAKARTLRAERRRLLAALGRDPAWADAQEPDADAAEPES